MPNPRLHLAPKLVMLGDVTSPPPPPPPTRIFYTSRRTYVLESKDLWFVTYDTVDIFNIIIKYDRSLSCNSYRY